MSLTPATSRGGSSPPYASRAEYTGLDVSIGNGATGYLTWDALAAGAALLSLATPDKPTVVTPGIYAVTALVNARAILSVGGIAEAVLHMDVDGDDAISQATFNAANANEFAITPLSCVYYVPAGAAIRVSVTNFDGVSTRSFKLLEACLQLLG